MKRIELKKTDMRNFKGIESLTVNLREQRRT